MRWKIVIAGLALSVAGVIGCKQNCFLMECDYPHYKDISTAMPRLECEPNISVTPTITAIPQPSRVDDPDRKLRFLTLQEAFALALENGTTGLQSILNPGQANPLAVGFNRQGPTSGSD